MKKIALLFPGQGSQYVGMGKALFKEYTIARQTFEQANEVLGFDLRKICFEGSTWELNRIENTLLALLTTSVAAFGVYMQEIGITPDFSAGHSLGEFSALTCCGAMNFEDALKIVQVRGRLAEQVISRGVGAMTIVNEVNPKKAYEECSKVSKKTQIVQVSCVNSSNQVAISGHTDAVMEVEERLLDIGAQVTPLIMSAPFHCSLMKDTANLLEKELIKYSYNELQWPVISNAHAVPYTEKGDIVSNLKTQLTSTVKWQIIMDYLYGKGVTDFIEMGSQSVLKNLIKLDIKGATAYAYGSKSDREEILRIKKNKQSINQSLKEKIGCTVITKCLAMAVSTRNRNPNQEEYEKGVIRTYERIEEIQLNLEEEGKEPLLDEMKKALKMLSTIFKTKKVPLNEQYIRFNRILDETNTRNLLNDFLEKELKDHVKDIAKFEAR